MEKNREKSKFILQKKLSFFLSLPIPTTAKETQ